MPRVKIVSEADARPVTQVPGCTGEGEAAAWLDGAAPIHLHRHRLGAGQSMVAEPGAIDLMLYVWRGTVSAGNIALPAGSSAVVEHGGSLRLVGGLNGATIVGFAAANGAGQLGGGHVHLLPADRVPRNPDLGTPGVGGAMHADGNCPTCALWLHENDFIGVPALAPDQQARATHAHTEDEVIFVTGGSIRLGQRLFGAGTALAVAKDTMYSLSPGPDGMTFINFRAGPPGAIRFANGGEMDEQAYWRDRLPRPEYLEPA